MARQEGKPTAVPCPRRVLCAGGGTGGHVYPGLAVVEQLLREGNFQVTWIGSKKGVEKTIVEDAGVPFVGVPAGKFRREFSLKNITDAFRVLGGIVASYFHLKRIRPDLVFSKGGFASVPPVIAAALQRVPIVSHESDVDPGLATRIALPFVKKLLVAYQESVELYPPQYRGRIVVTGNPVREAVYQGEAERGRELLGITGEKPVLLVLGGSQGALEINRLIWSTLGELVKDFTVVHQVGPNHTSAPELSSVRSVPGYVFRGYFKQELPHALALADVVVSRAGAGTLWELASVCKPMLLIPLRGQATRGDQLRNARLFELRGWAKVLYDEPVQADTFLREVRSLLEKETADQYRRNLRQLDARGARDRIVAVLKEYGGETV